MKEIKIILSICVVLLLSACASSPPVASTSKSDAASTSSISETLSASSASATTPAPSASSLASSSASSLASSSASSLASSSASSLASSSASSSSSSSANSAVGEPKIDTDLSDKLSTFMLENFGGSGNADFATSWYPFIGSLEVYSDGLSYYGVLELTESCDESTIRAVLSQYFTTNNLNLCVPILIDVGAALKLDTVAVCVMGESLAKILTGSSGLDVYYASLYSYGIPVYSYLATVIGVSESEVVANCGACGGAAFADLILKKMQEDFGGSFKGITSATTKTISLAALTGFHDAYLSEMVVVNPNGKEVATIKNTMPKK